MEDLFFADHDLGDAGSVAQVNECDTTVVTTPADPAGEGYGLSNVLGAKGSEVMCAQHSMPFRGGSRVMLKDRCGNGPDRVYPLERPRPPWSGRTAAAAAGAAPGEAPGLGRDRPG